MTAMRQQLVGYLCDALDEAEARELEAALSAQDGGAALRRELELLRQAIAPLANDRGSIDLPAGLASKTLAFVQAQSRPVSVPLRPMSPAADRSGPTQNHRFWVDRVLLAASALAACILVLPLVAEAITDSRARRVERRLQTLASAIHGYGESHRIYPTPPESGPLSRAGLYAPTLVSEHRLVADDGTVLVPGSKLDRKRGFRVPTLEELDAAKGTPRFEELVRVMGGDFGYTLGHRSADGRLQPNRALNRSQQPLLADAPAACCEKSDNHSDGFHYVVFEDGHFKRLREDTIHIDDDHLYRNHEGEVAAGVDPDDAVIGGSHHQP